MDRWKQSFALGFVSILMVVLLNAHVGAPINSKAFALNSFDSANELAQLADGNMVSIDTLKVGSDYVNIDSWELTSYNDYLYMVSSDIATGQGKMIIVDISDPTNLEEAGRVKDLGSCRQVSVLDDRAYVADFNNGLWIFNVSDPSDVSVLGRHSDYRPRGVYIDYPIAYLPTYYSGLRIINIADPTTPIEIGSYSITTSTYRVHVQDDLAYVANSDGLEILNVSDPSNPSYVGGVASSGFKTHIHLNDDLVFITRPWSRLILFNVSDPTNPFELEEFFMIVGVAEIQTDGTLLFATSSFLGLQAFDIHSYSSESDLGRFRPAGEARAVLLYEGYLYIVDHHSNLWSLEHDCDEDGLYSHREYEVGTPSDNPDADLDNLSDRLEVEVYHTDPLNSDTDSDSIPDGWEVQYGLDPLVVDSLQDNDGDDLSALDEYLAGTSPLTNDTDSDALSDSAELLIFGTSPTNPDSDFDLMTDGWEVEYSLNPLVDDSHLDLDMDSLTNLQEFLIGSNPTLADSDGDGYLDSWEHSNGFDPLNPSVGPLQYIVSNLGWLGMGVIVIMGIITTLWILKQRFSSESYEGYPYVGTSSRR